MEGQACEMDVDMCDVIFKTIYLFLETNSFHDTASSFLNEIKNRFHIDITSTNAKTLVLRPCLEEDGEEESPELSLSHNTPKKVKSIRPEVIEEPPESTNKCPDCVRIGNVNRHLQNIIDSVYPPNLVEIRLYKAWKLLQQVQESHTQLIKLGSDITNAISNLNVTAKEKLVNKCHQQIYEFYSYPGSHSSVDVVLILHNSQENTKLHHSHPIFSKSNLPEDKADYDIDSSLNEILDDSNKEYASDANYLETTSNSELDNLDSSLSGIEKIMTNKARVPNFGQTSHSASGHLKPSKGDADRRSPSRFGSECVRKKRHSTVYSSKSATLPVVGIRTTTPERSIKSRSATRLGEDRSNLETYTIGSVKRLVEGDAPIIQSTHSQATSTNTLRVKTELGPSLSNVEFAEELSELRRGRKPDRGRTRSDVSLKSPSKSMKSARSKPRNTPSDSPGDTSRGTEQITEKAKSSLEKQTSKTENGKSFSVFNAVNLEILKSPIPTALQVDIINTDSSEGEEGVYQRRWHQPNEQNRMQIEIDWNALKKMLYSGPADVKMKILQALRWRLTDSMPMERNRHLQECVKNDILSINTGSPHGQLFLESFYCPKKTPTPHPLQEEMARFINTFASLSEGRAYLERDESLLSVMLLPLLLGKLPGIKINNLTREFTMATIQKLSLNNKMREVIIRSGAIEWLVSFIQKNHHRMTTYEAEYSTALLTNLCINTEARNRAERIADRVVLVLEALLSTPHTCCLPYINPILYSLLLNPIINERATERNIGPKLHHLYHVYGDDEDLKSQLDPIIVMHETNDFCESENRNLEDMNYTDYIEPELSQQDPIYPQPGGDDLLLNFSCTTPSAEIPIQEETNYQTPKQFARMVQMSRVCNKPIQLQEHLVPEPPKPSKWQSRPTASARATLVSDYHLPCVTINQTKGTLMREPPTRSKPRSNSQPPLKRPPLTSKKETTLGVQLTPQRQPPPVSNCCFKMDYVNATAAPPGQFVPLTLNISSANLLVAGGVSSLDIYPEQQSDRNCCQCYTDIQQFIGSFNETIDNGTNHYHSTSSLLPRRTTAKSSEAGSQSPVFQMSDNTEDDIHVSYFGRKSNGSTNKKSKRRENIKVDYRVVSQDPKAAILKTYQETDMPKLSKKT